MKRKDKIEYLNVILSYYMHQNSLMWGRIKYCLTIQIVTIGGSYAVFPSLVSPLLLLVGALLCAILIMAFNRDREIRENNRAALDELNESIRKYGLRSKNGLALPGKPNNITGLGAGDLIRGVLWVLIALEIIVAIGLAVFIITLAVVSLICPDYFCYIAKFCTY